MCLIKFEIRLLSFLKQKKRQEFKNNFDRKAYIFFQIIFTTTYDNEWLNATNRYINALKEKKTRTKNNVFKFKTNKYFYS